jgi:NAD(P)-dependent dehydrogenase (short-subunit alcohol dehydrogenase family)
MDVTNLGGKTVLVTGAASGIGKETALAFARRGAALVVCDLNEAGLGETATQIRGMGRDVMARRVDVASRDDVRELAAAVHAQVDAVDILMNNAGVGLGASFVDTSLDDWDWIIGINLKGVIHGCHFFIPPMVARGRGGHVINVASAAAFVATEVLSAYSTTKYGVFGLSEALRDELQRHRIGVTAVCPGIINTAITATSPLRGANATPEMRQRMIEIYQRRNYGPERVASNILKAVQRNRGVAPISPEAWMMYYLKRLAPAAVRWVNRSGAARLQRQMTKKG